MKPPRDPRLRPPLLRGVLAVVAAVAALLVASATVASAAPVDDAASPHVVQGNDVSSWS